MRTIPPSESLQGMLAAAELGSLTAAAEELGVTHGALSRRIQSLETWLGQPIFDRHGRGVTLTPAGEMFARKVEKSLDAISTVATDLRTSGQRGTVRLSVLPSVARLWVMPRLKSLHGEPADLVIALSCEHRMAGLEAREADIAIRAGSGDWGGVQSHLLLSERMYPIASPVRARELVGASPADLLNETLLHDSDAGGWRRWFRERGAVYRPRGGERRFDDYDLTLVAAASGMGIALARDPLSQDMERAGAVVRLDDRDMPGDNSHFLVMRVGESRPSVLRVAERLLAMRETREA